MRLFTAFDPPDARCRRYATLQSDALDARWTPPANYHVTLRFIGEVDADAGEAFAEALQAVNAEAVTARPYGLDALPSRDNPRVLTVGLERTSSLMALYDAVSAALEAEGLDPEGRRYRPHVTLARLDDAPAEAVHRFIRSHEGADLEAFRVGTFHLYESRLTPDGAVHEKRRSYVLADE
jgi:2'-5' RNA ligase